MNLIDQDKLIEQLNNVLARELKDSHFHFIISVEDSPGTGFVLSLGNLNERSPFQSWKLIVTGLSRTVEDLLDKFKDPSGIKFNKPVEPK